MFKSTIVIFARGIFHHRFQMTILAQSRLTLPLNLRDMCKVHPGFQNCGGSNSCCTEFVSQPVFNPRVDGCTTRTILCRRFFAVGLSRLAYEIFSRGFSAQGSEFSHHMLICGSYVLNHIPKVRQRRR